MAVSEKFSSASALAGLGIAPTSADESNARFIAALLPNVDAEIVRAVVICQRAKFADWQGSDERKGEIKAERDAVAAKRAAKKAAKDAKDRERAERDREKILASAKLLGLVVVPAESGETFAEDSIGGDAGDPVEREIVLPSE